LYEPVDTEDEDVDEVEEEIDISTCGLFKYSSNIVNGRLIEEEEVEEEDPSNPYTDDNILPLPLLTFTGF